jgi:hypothetical protein
MLLGLQQAQARSGASVGCSVVAQGVSPGLRFVRCSLDIAAHAQPPDASAEGPSPRIVRFDELGEHPVLLPARASLKHSSASPASFKRCKSNPLASCA